MSLAFVVDFDVRVEANDLDAAPAPRGPTPSLWVAASSLLVHVTALEEGFCPDFCALWFAVVPGI